MKVATKLSLAFGVLLVILVSLLTYHVRTIRDAVDANYELSSISSRLYLSTTQQLSRIGEIEENASKYWITRDSGYLAKFNAATVAFDDAVRRLQDAPLDPPEREEVQRLTALWADFLPVAERWNAASAEGLPREATQGTPTALHQHADRLRAQARRLSEASQATMVARLRASADAARRAERVSWGAAAATLLLSVLISAFIVRSISGSLTRLKEGTQQVAEGNFAYRLPARHDDEFAQLARDFNVMTRQLGELDRMKSDFLSKVSHDLKTPLASMRETTRILLDEVPGPLTPKQERLLRLNHGSEERLSSMIGKLLDLSSMEAGTFTLDLRPYDLLSLVRLAEAQLEPQLREREVRVVSDLPEQPVSVDCDGDRVFRVLTNLLENAAKFSPAGGEIRVGVRYLSGRPDDVPVRRWRSIHQPKSTAGAAFVTLSDQGPGVPDREKERIFERFFQSEAGRRVPGRGVGLGLTICREIVDAHGGTIWVRDNPPRGSVFCVLLPRASMDSHLARVPADAVPQLS